MAPQVQRFCGLVAKAKLLDTAELEKAYRGWRASAPRKRNNLRGFIAYLIAHTGIKKEQVERLLTDSMPGTNDATANPTVNDEGEYEVVLVKARDPKRSLDRRDLLMLLGGAAAGAAAIVVPSIIAMSLNKKPQVKEDEAPVEKTEPQ